MIENDVTIQNEEYYKLIEEKFCNDPLYAAEGAEDKDAELIFDTTISFIKDAYNTIEKNASEGKMLTYYWLGYLCTHMNIACTIRERFPEFDDDILKTVSEMLAFGTSAKFKKDEI